MKKSTLKAIVVTLGVLLSAVVVIASVDLDNGDPYGYKPKTYTDNELRQIWKTFKKLEAENQAWLNATMKGYNW